MSRPTLRGLYAITDSTLMADDRRLLDSVEQALRGGARIVQYRDKSDDDAKRLRQASALNELCRRFEIPLIINDDPQLAHRSGAAGVHLGQQDGALAETRQLLGAEAIIGITCHDSLALAQHAARGGADYVAFGAFFPSRTKPDARPARLSVLDEARRQVQLPTVAIGGISVDNAGQIIAAGADMVAVVHALFAADDIRAQARRFQQQF
ncbi:thiamine phosphate synthase [Marinobacterium arenosum]|uniref:thiamine phosphate synthase n=1 Tax=Marinobacterium arenosum TaxID=2862496 RepID=UPI001C941358|nr:thiamine phosphate synthase [Marinobacterium arenosum]MBY4678303.1 thiamine phosphate synthase [Marinobacterium arenosum]